MDDLATLGIKIDASQVDTGVKKLDDLTNAGKRTEDQTKETESATKGLQATLAKVIGAIEANTRATMQNSAAMDDQAASARSAASAEEIASAAVNKATASAKASANAKRDAAAAAALAAAADREAAASANALGNAIEQATGRVINLKASVDPYGVALDRANAEMREADALHRAGAISATEHAQAIAVLSARSEVFAGKQALANAALMGTRKQMSFTATEGLNFSRQMADIGVTAAMGMNPLMIAIQQGPQLFDILQTSAMRTGATITSTMRAATVSALGFLAPFLPAIAAIAAGVAILGGAWALATRSANQEIGKNIDHLKLNEKQLKKLKDESVNTGVTMGDVFKGVGKTIGDALNAAFGPTISKISKQFNDWLDDMTKKTVNDMKVITGAFIGGFYVIRDTWKMLPGAIGDLAITAANSVIAATVKMINGAIGKINELVNFANSAAKKAGLNVNLGTIGEVKGMQLDNPYAGQASATGAAMQASWNSGMDAGGRVVDGTLSTIGRNVREARDERVTKAAGEAGTARKGRAAGKSDEEKEYEKQVEAAQEFIKSLKEETAEIGKNELQVRRMAAERAMALAPTKELKDGIKAAADEWERATVQFANDELKRSLSDTADDLAFETRLIGMNAKEREVATAQREIDLRLRELERQGISVNAEAIAAETKAILDNAAARGQLQLDVDNANEFADTMGRVASNVRDAANSFGDLFGSAGKALGDLTSIIVDFDAQQADSLARLAQARMEYGEESVKYKEIEATATREASQAEIRHYGDMLGAAKGFFNERSAGYKVLEAAERAYRIYQFAMAVQEMVMDATVTGSKVANSATRMATDGAETASSVAKSGIRAAADGVAAFAKTLASIPFPFNLAAGAVVLAALVGVGVAMKGGSKGNTATASAARAEEVKPTSYTPFTSHDTGIRASNDNRISPSYSGGASASSNKTVVVQFNGNISGNDPEETKRQVRDVFEAELAPAILNDARQQSAQDMQAMTRQTLGRG